MSQLASRAQLRMSYIRWALVTVPAVVFLGFLSGQLSGSSDSAWFRALERPAIMPPDWLFGVAWSVLYVLLGLALALVLNARSANGRTSAILLFVAQLGLNLSWSPVFFGAHRVLLAFLIILAVLVLALATTFVFARVRPGAAWLMVPYLLWLGFASVLNWQTHRLNPNAESLVPQASRTQIAI